MECYFVSLKVKVFWREMKKEKKLKFKEKKGLSSFLYLHCSGGLLSIHSWASIGRVISPPRMVKSRASSVLCTAAPDVRLSSSCQVMIDSFDPMTDQACFTRGICCILAGTRELHTAQDKTVQMGEPAPRSFRSSQKGVITWGIVGIPWLQCSVWDTHRRIKASNWSCYLSER